MQQIQRTPIRQGMANPSAPFPLNKNHQTRPLQQPSYLNLNTNTSNSATMSFPQNQIQSRAPQNGFFPPAQQQQATSSKHGSHHPNTQQHQSSHQHTRRERSMSSSESEAGGGTSSGPGQRRRRDTNGGYTGQQEYGSAFLRGPPGPGFVDTSNHASKRGKSRSVLSIADAISYSHLASFSIVFAALPPKRQSNGFRPVSLPNS